MHIFIYTLPSLYLYLSFNLSHYKLLLYQYIYLSLLLHNYYYKTNVAHCIKQVTETKVMHCICSRSHMTPIIGNYKSISKQLTDYSNLTCSLLYITNFIKNVLLFTNSKENKI